MILQSHAMCQAVAALGCWKIHGSPGAFAQLDQGIGMALRHGAGVGLAFGRGAADGELLDQRANHAAMLGIQPALQPEPSVSAIPQPQFSSGRGGGRGFLDRLGPVRVQDIDHPLRDERNRRGSKSRA